MGVLLSICFKGKATGPLEPKVPIRSSKKKAAQPTQSAVKKQKSLNNQHLLGNQSSGTGGGGASKNYQSVDSGYAKSPDRESPSWGKQSSSEPQSPHQQGSFFSPPSSPRDKNSPQSEKKSFSRTFSVRDKKGNDKTPQERKTMSFRLKGSGASVCEESPKRKRGNFRQNSVQY